MIDSLPLNNQNNNNPLTKLATSNSQKGLQAYANAYDFSFTTSSGDTLTLSMNSKTSTAFSKNENGSSHALYREFSYQMKYEGNGLDANDKKEIQKALEEAQPMMQSFFEKANESESKAIDAFRNNLASSLKQSIAPHTNEQNIENVKDETAKSIGGTLSMFDVNERLFTQAAKLFEEIFDTSKLLNFKI